MFLAVIAFIISSFRHYIMFNHQNVIEDDNNEDDDETSRFDLFVKIDFSYLFIQIARIFWIKFVQL
jgi:hypothetical protein